MDNKDFYYTIGSVTEGMFRDRGSRFIAFAVPVSNAEDARLKIEYYRKKYHDARHHCFAYITGSRGENQRSNDDGEPSGTAGNPIMAQIRSRNLTNILVIVIRYFGGKLLGTAGLVNAYRAAAADALDKATVIECILYSYYSVIFPYNRTGHVMKILNDFGAKISGQHFTEKCSLTAGIRLSLADKALARLAEFPEIEIKAKED
ncbi:MAG: YigZ family protein [Bacteroidales bacterium]|nr:YigZ family protein [Bacteroidales bacterium]